MTATFETLCQIDGRLVAAGMHPLTPWWHEQMRRFYEHPTAHTFVGQVGRGGAKSHTACKVALNETLFGDWRIPPGERHYWIHTSENKDEAAQRLRFFEDALTALGVQHRKDGDQVYLMNQPRGLLVRAFDVGAVSGFRGFGRSHDELAKCKADVEQARSVVGSAAAMCVSHPGARCLLISSPVSVIDLHYERFAAGDSDHQIVANAPSWVANPGVTEEQTHELEPDPQIWQTEYAATPAAALGSPFEPDDVIPAFGALPEGYELGRAFCGIDTSKLRGDGLCYAIGTFARPSAQVRYRRLPPPPGMSPDIFVGWETDEWGRQIALPQPTQTVLRVAEIGGWEDDVMRQTTAESCVADIAARCHRWGIGVVFADDFESVGYAGMFGKHDIKYRPYAWNIDTKAEAITTLRRYFRERAISIVPHEKMKRELLSIQARATQGGKWHYTTTGKDFASALIAIAIALNDGEVLGMPKRLPWTRIDAAPHAYPAGRRYEFLGR